MARKPKPIEVGHVGCPFHSEHSQAKVKKSLVTNKLFIDCPKCGLIMPTLANFQEWIKANATFNEDFSEMYGDGRKYEGGGKPEPEQSGSGNIPGESNSGSKADDRAGKAGGDTNGGSNAGDLPRKPEKVKSDYEQEMGF